MGRSPGEGIARVLALLIAISLTGCALFGGTPTPLPWIPTATPESGGSAQVANTATPSLPSATQTPTASPVTPSPTPTVVPTDTPVRQVITLDVPIEAQEVGNPLEIRGHTTQVPFEGTLVIRVYDARDQLAAEEPTIAIGELGGPAAFSASITYGGVPGPGRVEVLDLSARDGSVIAKATAPVTLQGFPGGGEIEMPAPMETVTLPIRVLARVGKPGDQVNVTVGWDDGSQFAHVFTTLGGLDGRGLLIVPLDWVGPSPSAPPTQMGTLMVHTLQGSPLAWQRVQILHRQDPGTRGISVFWTVNEDLARHQIRIPQTQGIGRASLEALLWGPVPQNDAGFTTAIPTAEEVLTFGGRESDWGERVRLNSLSITGGVAQVDFSREMTAHPGGATRVSLIRSQIEETLLQFSTVDEVVITIEGQDWLLEP